MSREIKFRAWIVDRGTGVGKMYFDIKDFHSTGLLLQYFEDRCVTGEDFLMQFTGLKNKNGVEMYEADIVEFEGHVGNFYEDRKRATLTGEVFYKTEGSIDYCFRVGDRNYGLNSNDVNDYKIIGNIHEHKNLLDKD